MGSLTLTKPSQSRCREPRLTLGDLIDEWLPKLAVNAGAALDAKTQAVFRSVWLDGLGDLSPEVLRAAFQATLRTCKFWPVKVADIREHISSAIARSADEAAEQAWNYVLDLRRVYWNPDMPGGFSRGMPRLRDRIAQAARAAGVWRDFDSVADLHTWAKKRFFESFKAYSETEQDAFLLPDGPIKKMLDWFAYGKAMPRRLPAAKQEPTTPPEERLRVADELAAAAKAVLASYKPKEHIVTVSDEVRQALKIQGENVKRSFPMRPEAFSENPRLRKVYERFGLEIPEKQAEL